MTSFSFANVASSSAFSLILLTAGAGWAQPTGPRPVHTVTQYETSVSHVPVPPPPLRERPSQMRSVPLLASGIALSAIGLGTVVAGNVYFVNGVNADQCFDDFCTSDDGSKIRGGVLLGVGSALTAAGVPMIFVGAQREEGEASSSPQVLVGSRGAAVRWRF